MLPAEVRGRAVDALHRAADARPHRERVRGRIQRVAAGRAAEAEVVCADSLSLSAADEPRGLLEGCRPNRSRRARPRPRRRRRSRRRGTPGTPAGRPRSPRRPRRTSPRARPRPSARRSSRISGSRKLTSIGSSSGASSRSTTMQSSMIRIPSPIRSGRNAPRRAASRFERVLGDEVRVEELDLGAGLLGGRAQPLEPVRRHRRDPLERVRVNEKDATSGTRLRRTGLGRTWPVECNSAVTFLPPDHASPWDSTNLRETVLGVFFGVMNRLLGRQVRPAPPSAWAPPALLRRVRLRPRHLDGVRRAQPRRLGPHALGDAGSRALLIADFLPAIAIGLTVGPLVDRLSRRRVMVVGRRRPLPRLLHAPVRARAPAQIVALAAVAGFATGFFRPAVYAGLPNLVEDDGAAERTGAAAGGRRGDDRRRPARRRRARRRHEPGLGLRGSTRSRSSSRRC